MFSQRTRWGRAENPLTQAIRAARAEGPILDLTASNPTQVGLGFPPEAFAQALARGAAEPYAPEPFGLPKARAAVAAYYQRRGVSVSPEQVLLVATTSEAYAFLFRLLADPGDRILAPAPSYPLFEFLAELADVRLESHRLVYEGRWRLDRVSLDVADGPRAKAVVTVSPNNPTGSCLETAERAHLVEWARARSMAIIADEVFLDYLDDPRAFAAHTFAGESGALSFTLSGLSKVAALPHAKLAWIVVGGPEALAAEARARLEIIADTFLSVATPIQAALPELLEAAEATRAGIRARVAANLETLATHTAGTPLELRARDGGWYAVLSRPGADDEAWALELLEKHRVLAHPGYLFDFEEDGCLVLSALAEPEVFTEGVARLVASLEPL